MNDCPIVSMPRAGDTTPHLRFIVQNEDKCITFSKKENNGQFAGLIFNKLSLNFHSRVFHKRTKFAIMPLLPAFY